MIGSLEGWGGLIPWGYRDDGSRPPAHGAQTPPLFRDGRRGASFRPRREAPAHGAATVEPSDSVAREGARLPPVPAFAPQRRAHAGWRGAARARTAHLLRRGAGSARGAAR